MKRIEIKLDVAAVAPLLDLVRAEAGELKTHLAVRMPPLADDGDSDMDAMCRESLLASQNAGVAALLSLFDAEFLETGVVRIDARTGGEIIRACSALRLQLRAHLLADISDETLEGGVADFATRPPATQRALMAYMLLATLQELIIRHFETAIIGEEGEGGE